MVDAVDALNLAIEREKGAYSFYSEAAERSTDAAGKKMFAWLASEEQGHIKLLERQCTAVKEGKWLPEEEAAAGCNLSKPIQSSEFPSISEVEGSPSTAAPEMEILSKAMAAEKEASAFYAEVAEGVSDPNGKAMLQKLSQIEKGHLELLEEEYEFLRRSKPLFTIHRFTLPPSG